MPRVERSAWTTLDIQRIKELYPTERMDQIIRLLGSMSSAKKQEIKKRISNVVFMLHLKLHDERRPTLAQQLKGLGLLCETLNTSLNILFKLDQESKVPQLDPDSKARIEAIADRDPQADHEDRYRGGQERLRQATQHMKALSRWTTTALEELEGEAEVKGPPELRKRGYPLVKAAIMQLREIWIVREQVVANVAPLPRFVEAALRPVLDENNCPANLKSLVYSI